MTSSDENAPAQTRIDRRAVFGLGAAALAASTLGARAQTQAEIIPLWPDTPPGGAGLDLAHRVVDNGGNPSDRHLSNIAAPVLTVFRPPRPDGSALLIAPGGGYLYEAFDFEGVAPSQLFAASGVTCFVLTYRLPAEGWVGGADVPLQDAQRAMRLLRKLGPTVYGLDPARIGVLGFSAGGHLAGSLATRFAAKVYDAIDDADEFDARPTFAALLYPVVTMLKPFAHEASRTRLLGADPPQALRGLYSVENSVSADTPPCFLCAAADDPDVPVENTLGLFRALRTAKVPAEMHVFESGGHGFGLGAPGRPEAQWPTLLLDWGRQHGWFRNAARE